MAFDNLMVFTGNANPKLAQKVAKQLNVQLGKASVSKFSDGEVMVELLENVRGKDVLRAAVDLRADERPPDGIDDHGRRAAALERGADHRGDAVLRLRAPGPPAAERAGGDLGEGGGEHADGGRREPGADDGPARRPDPGVLRHPGGQRLRDADPAGRPVEARVQEPGGGVAGRRRRGAGTGDREAAGDATSRSSTSAARGRTSPR